MATIFVDSKKRTPLEVEVTGGGGGGGNSISNLRLPYFHSP